MFLTIATRRGPISLRSRSSVKRNAGAPQLNAYGPVPSLSFSATPTACTSSCHSPADRHRPAGLAHDLFAVGLGQMPNAEICKRRIAERHGGRRQLIFLEARNRCKVSELGQSIGQPRNGRLWQVGSGGDLLIAEKPV